MDLTVLDPFLKTGMTRATLTLFGTNPEEKEQLNRVASGPELIHFRVFSSFVGTLYGPVALEELRLSILSSISIFVTGKRARLLQGHCLKKVS